MPLFYLLSGFTLSLNYARTTWTNCSFWSADPGAGDSIFNSKRFYQRRIAKVGPMFYLANILHIPLLYTWSGLSDIRLTVIKLVLTMTMTNTWFQLTDTFHPFAYVSWTVTTLSFFYLMFPILLPGLQALSSKQLGTLMVWLFHLQLLPTTMLFLHSVIITQTQRSIFWLTTAMPLLRYVHYYNFMQDKSVEPILSKFLGY